MATLAIFSGLQGGKLDAATVFTSIALFENMKDPLSTLPDRITSYVDLAVASQRLQRFLAREEIALHRQSPRSDGTQQRSTDAIVIRGSFGWGVSSASEERASGGPRADGDTPTQNTLKNKAPTAAQRKYQHGRGYTRIDQEEDNECTNAADDDATATDVQAPLLRGLNLRVRHGDLVMIIGTVGSGKSNLLSAVLGEMTPLVNHDDTTCTFVNGQVAYMGQTAWILNMTLRNNVIISGQQDPVDEERYQEALRVSGLLEDLDALPAGDRTEIGARGINISGGQKARVCLARLVYSEATICLLDDPTAALDSTMSAHVFENCIHGTLQHQGRTRLMVTNVVEPAVLRRADSVVWMEHGKIRACGRFDELESMAQEQQQSRNHHNSDGARSIAFAELLSTRRKASEDDAASGEAQEQITSETKGAIRPRAGGDKVAGASGKLVNAEDRETGVVAQTVYYRLFRHAGVGLVTATACAFIVSTSAQIGRDWYLAYWTDDSEQAEPTAAASSFLGWFALLTLSFVLLTLLRAIMLVMVGYYCSISLHKQMTTAILFSPLSFFDVTPTGRVLNRFAKDTESVCCSKLTVAFLGLPYIYRVVGMIRWMSKYGRPGEVFLTFCFL